MRATNSIQEKYDRWANTIRKCQNSGKSVTKWCMENNIPRKTYYNHYYKIRDNAYEEYKDLFEPKERRRPLDLDEEIKLNTNTHNHRIFINVDDITISFPETIPYKSLKKIVKAVKMA